MYILMKLSLILTFLSWSQGFSPEGELLEYCQPEAFQPHCSEDEVIVMQEARYGHIKLGRCVDEDFGRLGCYVDQLSVLDKRCSGQRSCEIYFSDTDMEGTFPCTLSKALARYLEASFICQAVYKPPLGSCSSTVTVGSRLTFLSSETTKELGCGGKSNPWLLRTRQGQQINISFIDFNWKLKSRNDATENCPLRYGYMVDEESNDVVNLCGGLIRERNIYTTKGNRIQILLARNVLDSVNFLIGYKAIGCPKYKAPPGTMMQEKDGYIIVGCVGSDDKWKMRCIGTHWLGPLRDCTQYTSQEHELKSAKSTSDESTVLNLPPVVAFAIFGGLVLVLISIVATIIIGIFCIRKSKPRPKMDDATVGRNNCKPPLLLPLDNFATYKSVQVRLPKKKEPGVNHMKSEDPFGSISTLASLGSVPRRPPSLRESPHYYLLDGRDTTETEPLYDVVYQGLPTQDTA